MSSIEVINTSLLDYVGQIIIWKKEKNYTNATFILTHVI